MKKVMLGVVLGAAASASVEATDSKVPVFTRNQCTNDTVGDRLMFRVREGIRTSASLSLVEEYGNSVIQLSVVCLDPDSSEQSIVSRYSYSVTAYNSKKGNFTSTKANYAFKRIAEAMLRSSGALSVSGRLTPR